MSSQKPENRSQCLFPAERKRLAWDFLRGKSGYPTISSPPYPRKHGTFFTKTTLLWPEADESSLRTPYPPLLFFLPAPALPKVEGPSDASWLPSLLPRGRVREMAIRQSLRRLEPDFEPGSPETGLTENGFPSLPVALRHACRVCPSFTRTRLTGFSSFRRRRKSCPPSPTTRSSPTGCQGDPRLRRRQRVRSFSSKDMPGHEVRTTGQGSRLKEAGGRRSDCARPL